MNKLNSLRVLLYKQYCKELDQYDDFKLAGDGEKIAADYITATKNSDVTWKDITHYGEIVGFLIINPRPLCMHIMEAFVLPKHRRKGLMLGALQNALKGHKGDVVLEVLKRNPAQEFWAKALDELGFVKTAEDVSWRNHNLMKYRYKRKE